jgi:ABC transporter with metal-binding/Fe-S-binding domain ATP-binding protein
VLFSGGKDSTYAALLAKDAGHSLRYFVSVLPENRESYMFHSANIRLTSAQAELAGVEHVIVHTKGEKEKELGDLKKALGLLDVQGVVSGAIASEYQKSRVDAMCRELGLQSIALLWHRPGEAMLNEELRLGFETYITSVSAEGLDESWLGRRLDAACIADLRKLRIHPAGEGGEYCTFVAACPLFSKRIIIKKAQKHWQGDRGWLEIGEIGYEGNEKGR